MSEECLHSHDSWNLAACLVWVGSTTVFQNGSVLPLNRTVGRTCGQSGGTSKSLRLHEKSRGYVETAALEGKDAEEAIAITRNIIILPELQICAALIQLVGCNFLHASPRVEGCRWDMVASFVSALFAAQMDIQKFRALRCWR